jgi:ribonuclease E
LRTNIEAVEEATRQLRLRDLGGLVVLDLIDMRERKSRRQVEAALREALSRDRARIRLGRMGPFGCVILSRQRIRQALTRITHEECATCGGTGRHRHATGLGLRILREMQARIARSRGRGGLEVRAPQNVIDWIKRNRSGELRQLRKQCSGSITLKTDGRLASDGWAMKGLPPSEGGGAGEDD